MVNIELYNVGNEVEDKKLALIDKDLPKPPFRWIYLGATGAGKSSIIENVVFNKKWGYIKYFDEIYAYIGSLDDVEKFKDLVKHFKVGGKVQINQEFDAEEVKDLFDDIEKDAIKKNPPKVLFIFDDQVCNDLTSRGKTNIIDQIFIRGRHANISCIISTQKYRMLNKNTRSDNASHISIFSSTSKAEINAVVEENSGMYTEDQFKDAIKANLKSKYDFVTVNNVSGPEFKLMNNKFKFIHIGDFN